jgi:hypothetical protein
MENQEQNANNTAQKEPPQKEPPQKTSELHVRRFF